MMRSYAGLRQIARSCAVRAAPGACISAALLMKPTTLRLDSAAPAPSATQYRAASRSSISPRAVQQLSSGSIAGFGTGLLVALLSKTLVFLGGLFAISCYVAARCGVDLSRMLGVRKLLNNPALWRKTGSSPYFAASFVTTFILAAFVRL